MEDGSGKLLRIGVFYDGQYFYKISNYYSYEHERRARLSIAGLHEFIRNEVSNVTGRDIRQCRIVDAHYFRGRFSAKESDAKNMLLFERRFDDILMRENVTTHYLPLKKDPSGRTLEKGVDVWLALEAFELAIYKRFDFMVLIACDGDFAPLVRKVNTLGSQVMLLSWDFEYQDKYGLKQVTKTAQALIDEVSYPVEMNDRINSRKRDSYVDGLFMAPSKERQLQSEVDTIPDDIPRKNLETSTILSLKEGYGFIKDESTNNVFFHYTSLVNMDFNDLEDGMKVEFVREKQIDDTGKERQIATEVHAFPDV